MRVEESARGELGERVFGPGEWKRSNRGGGEEIGPREVIAQRKEKSRGGRRRQRKRRGENALLSINR